MRRHSSSINQARVRPCALAHALLLAAKCTERAPCAWRQAAPRSSAVRAGSGHRESRHTALQPAGGGACCSSGWSACSGRVAGCCTCSRGLTVLYAGAAIAPGAAAGPGAHLLQRHAVVLLQRRHLAAAQPEQHRLACAQRMHSTRIMRWPGSRCAALQLRPAPTCCWGQAGQALVRVRSMAAAVLGARAVARGQQAAVLPHQRGARVG